MKMILGFVLLMFTATSHAQWARSNQNIKLPNQEVFEHMTITAPAAPSTTRILSANQADTDGTGKTVTTFSAQPDVPRNLVVTPAGTTADIPTGNVVINGKDINENTISETFAFTANDTLAQTGSKAFKSVTSIVFPAEDSPYGAKWSVGIGSKLGLKRCMNGTGYFIKGLVDSAVLTGTTVAANTTSVANNTVIPNPDSNASRIFDFLYVQNFQCK